MFRQRSYENRSIWQKLGMCSFRKIRIRIIDPRLFGLWCVKGTDESLITVDPSVRCSFIIQRIFDHWPWSASSKRNKPLLTLNWIHSVNHNWLPTAMSYKIEIGIVRTVRNLENLWQPNTCLVTEGNVEEERETRPILSRQSMKYHNRRSAVKSFTNQKCLIPNVTNSVHRHSAKKNAPVMVKYIFTQNTCSTRTQTTRVCSYQLYV